MQMYGAIRLLEPSAEGLAACKVMQHAESLGNAAQTVSALSHVGHASFWTLPGLIIVLYRGLQNFAGGVSIKFSHRLGRLQADSSIPQKLIKQNSVGQLSFYLIALKLSSSMISRVGFSLGPEKVNGRPSVPALLKEESNIGNPTCSSRIYKSSLSRKRKI